jgi:hypothetical protein
VISINQQSTKGAITMASKTVPAKKISTNATESTDPEVTILKKATCPTLSGTGKIGYAISADDTGSILFGLTSNNGAGYFSKTKVGFNEIVEALKALGKKQPITSLALKGVYPANSSINNFSFALACLLAEGLVEIHPDHPRRYHLSADPDAFLAAMKELTPSDSKPGKATGKVKATAGARMSKDKAKPATS